MVRIVDNDHGVRFAHADELQVGDAPRRISLEVPRGDDGAEPVTVEYATVDGNRRGPYSCEKNRELPAWGDRAIVAQPLDA
jgi:hypothetical protein